MKILSILPLMFLISCNSTSKPSSDASNARKEVVLTFEGDIESLTTVDYHTSCSNGSNTAYKYQGNGQLTVRYNRFENADCTKEYVDYPLVGSYDSHVLTYTCELDENVLNCELDENYYTWMVDHFALDINDWDIMSCIDNGSNLSLQTGDPNYEDGDCEESVTAQFVLTGTKEELTINGQQLNYVE